MRSDVFDETIIALSTPPGEAALHVIRLSGSQAEKIVDSCFQTLSQAWLRGDVSVLCLGWFCDGETKIDQVMAVRMKAPASFTGEDVVEINCHGGRVIARSIIDVCCRLGARLALPGEFSKRAFLHGKIDLIQAEAIIDLIHAKNEMSAGLAAAQLEGALSQGIQDLRGQLADMLADIEAHLDFPEEDVDLVAEAHLEKHLLDVREAMQEALHRSAAGKIIRDGITTVIAGAPNVGKSSLMNALSGEERSIVTDIPGTTRDEIHEYVAFGDMVLHVIDTAGLRDSDDPVEMLGIDRAKKAIERADIVLFLLDAERVAQGMFLPQELDMMRDYGEKIFVLVNKTDLLSEDFHRGSLPSCFAERDEKERPLVWIPFSVKRREGFAELEAALRKKFLEGFDLCGKPVLSNIRQIEAVRRALVFVERALTALGSHVPFDLVAVDMMSSLEELSLVTGHGIREDVIERIFQRFCIGK